MDSRGSAPAYFRPWIFLITDSAPTDEWQSLAETVRQGEESRRAAFFVLGVEGADFSECPRRHVGPHFLSGPQLKITGFGAEPARELAFYGIETAYDVREDVRDNIRGIGPKRRDNLLELLSREGAQAECDWQAVSQEGRTCGSVFSTLTAP